MTTNKNIVLSELNDNGILRLTLNDSQRRNVLSESMINELTEAFNDAKENNEVRVIVLAANGPAFCAGHDLKEITNARAQEDAGQSYFKKILNLCSQLMQVIVNNPKPVIAEVAGIATAAGCQLVASCDLAIATREARFATPGVHIGLFCSTPMVALSRNVSNKQAMEMLLLGDFITADRACSIGLINKAVDQKELTVEVMQMAEKMAAKSSTTLAMGKEAFYVQKEMPLDEAYVYASKVMVANMLKADAKEGISAFIEKRKPQWQVL